MIKIRSNLPSFGRINDYQKPEIQALPQPSLLVRQWQGNVLLRTVNFLRII
jgi:hypothetical protein